MKRRGIFLPKRFVTDSYGSIDVLKGKEKKKKNRRKERLIKSEISRFGPDEFANFTAFERVTDSVVKY